MQRQPPINSHQHCTRTIKSQWSAVNRPLIRSLSYVSWVSRAAGHCRGKLQAGSQVEAPNRVLHETKQASEQKCPKRLQHPQMPQPAAALMPCYVFGDVRTHLLLHAQDNGMQPSSVLPQSESFACEQHFTPQGSCTQPSAHRLLMQSATRPPCQSRGGGGLRAGWRRDQHSQSCTGRSTSKRPVSADPGWAGSTCRIGCSLHQRQATHRLRRMYWAVAAVDAGNPVINVKE